MGYAKKEDQKACAAKHYQENKAVYKARAVVKNKEVRQRNRDIIYEHLKLNPCVDCGEADPIVLEFDHVRGTKIMEIAAAVINNWSVLKLQTEIDKCEIRCANCHRRKTHLRRIDKFFN